MKHAVENRKETLLTSSSMVSLKPPAQTEFITLVPVRTWFGCSVIGFRTWKTSRGSVATVRNLEKGNPIPVTAIDIDILRLGEVDEFAENKSI